MHELIGYFDSPEQTKPAHDPGLNVPCIICYKPLEKPMTTISTMVPGDARSYFYRAHKACYEGLSDDDVGDLEWSIMRPPERR